MAYTILFILAVFSAVSPYAQENKSDEPIGSIMAPFAVKKMILYPNPTNGIVHIRLDDLHEYNELKIFNAIGQVVSVVAVSPGNKVVTVDLGKMHDGVYVVTAHASKYSDAAKLVLIK